MKFSPDIKLVCGEVQSNDSIYSCVYRRNVQITTLKKQKVVTEAAKHLSFEECFLNIKSQNCAFTSFF